MLIVRPSGSGTGNYTNPKGVYTRCQRSGRMYPHEQMVKEPGTDLWVHKKYSDGIFNRVQHMNFKDPAPEPQRIKDAFPFQDLGLVLNNWLIDGDGQYIEVNAKGDFVSTGLPVR